MDSPKHDLWRQYQAIRAHTESLAARLSAEDQCVQSMPDASPTKWHLGHTTWFFETLVLRAHLPHYQVFDKDFHFIFNSYYESLGPRQPRPRRGMLTRPGRDAVQAYRRHVDAAIERLLSGHEAVALDAVRPALVLGLHHEQQHQELIVTDIVHLFSCNPLLPAYLSTPLPRSNAWDAMHGGSEPSTDPIIDAAPSGSAAANAINVPANTRAGAVPAAGMRWLHHHGGKVDVGHAGAGFAFDNETPRHTVWLQSFDIADRLVSCGEYLRFVHEGGYRNASWWLSDGWAMAQDQGWQAPPYWLCASDPRVLHHADNGGCQAAPEGGRDDWVVFGPYGVQPLDPDAPVSGLSFYEACAYADWAGARLPTEFEWEAACDAGGMAQAYDHVWQWTRSAYAPYPGFRPLEGPAAEYNGKFMVGQQVLRGGSVATPPGHSRPTYRNFFPPSARWQFTGLRLARDA